ncbi:MAG: TonB-dependent receptor, partial [Luteibaculum sp.]
VLVANVQSQSKVQQHIPKISTNIRKGNFETTLLARSQIERAQFYSMDALGNQVSRNIVALSNQSSWYLGTTSLELNATVQAYKESTPLYSGRIAFSSPLSPGLRADLSIEQNLRIPTLNDLYWRPGGNPNLQPEQARSIELGTYWQGIKTSRNLHATLFYRQTQQWIQWRPTEFAFWRPFNLDQVTSFGLDASFSWSDIAVGNSGMLAKEELVLGLNRSYLCADASKHQLMYIPKITANFWQYLKWHAVEIAAGLQFVGERETETAEEFQSFHRLEPFVLLHSKIAYQIGRKYCDLKLAFSVNNLLDRPYQNILWRAMPGRNFNLSFVLLI